MSGTWHRPKRSVVAGVAAAVLLAAAVAAGSAPASSSEPGGHQPGTPVAHVDPASVPGADRLDDGRWAVPLRAESPRWLTPELVDALERDGRVAAPAGAVAPDVPLSGYVGIRPGSQMVLPSGCTMNFVFQQSGTYAIGTAGHCVEEVGQPVTLLTIAPGSPPRSEHLALVTIGEVITMRNNGVGDDFALVSIKPELQSWVFPTIPVVAGPCGAYTADGGPVEIGGWNPFVKDENPVEVGETVWHYGHGVGIGTGGTPRAGVATAWTADAFYWAGAVVFGDSGSAARVTDLKAAGDVTHLVVDLQYAAVNAGTRIGRILAIADGWSLVSSPHCA